MPLGITRAHMGCAEACATKCESKKTIKTITVKGKNNAFFVDLKQAFFGIPTQYANVKVAPTRFAFLNKITPNFLWSNERREVKWIPTTRQNVLAFTINKYTALISTGALIIAVYYSTDAAAKTVLVAALKTTEDAGKVVVNAVENEGVKVVEFVKEETRKLEEVLKTQVEESSSFPLSSIALGIGSVSVAAAGTAIYFREKIKEIAADVKESVEDRYNVWAHPGISNPFKGLPADAVISAPLHGPGLTSGS